MKDALGNAQPKPDNPGVLRGLDFGKRLIGQTVHVLPFGVNMKDPSIERALPLPAYGITIVQYK